MNNNEPSVTPPTDVIISHYESLMTKNIAAKTLGAWKDGNPPAFSKEEIAFLNKKSAYENPLAEVQVVTPAPTITLKKGSTEINVKNAAEVLQRMEERYPTGVPTKQNPLVTEQTVEQDPNETIRKLREETMSSSHHTETKTVNKNAYEIRSDILSQALAWIQYKRHISNESLPPTEDEVLAVARKFYNFVENKR